MPHELLVLAPAVGIPLCLARLWWIWWKSDCAGRGLQHSACTCPSDHMMWPRR